MKRHTPLAVICAIVVLGFAATAVSAQRNARSIEQSNEQAVERASEQAAEEMVTAIASDFAITGSLTDLSVVQRITMAEYRTLWSGSFSGVFEGDSSASLYVAVAPEDVANFADAMQALAPGFAVSYLADEPSDLGHIITAMTATESEYVGSDMTVLPGMAQVLDPVGDGDSVVVGFDRRFDDRPGQMQVIRGHRLLGTDDVERRAWTIVHVDQRPNAQRILDELGEQFGATITASGVGSIGTYGSDRDGAAITRTATAADGDFFVTVQLWSDGSEASDASSNRVWLIGLLLTLGAVLLAGLGLLFAALLARLGSSDRDARSDVLTGLHNRRWITEQLAELAERQTNVALLFCDLDRFKVVNDSAGHTVGDELLLQVGRRLRRAAEGLGEVARWGGDEFVVLCETAADPHLASLHAADKIVEMLGEPFEISTGSVRISTSIGIATMRTGEEITADELVRKADVALGRCKELRTSGYVVYDESLKDDELDRLGLEADLQSSLDNSDLLVYYQPIVDIHGTAVSYEALARWRRNGQVLEPSEFLPLAAEIGRMEDVDRAVMHQALATLARAIAGGQTELTMHVNVDAFDLTNRNFPELVWELLVGHGVEPRKLILELTEGEWFDAIDSITPVLRSLTEMGVGLAIDDFGSGYSSLGRLLKIPGLTELKIDQLMVDSIADDDVRIFLTSLIGGLQELGLKVISEGVETDEQFGLLQAMGVTYFQGYLFGEPAPSAEDGLGPLPVDVTSSSTFA